MSPLKFRKTITGANIMEINLSLMIAEDKLLNARKVPKTGITTIPPVKASKDILDRPLISIQHT